MKTFYFLLLLTFMQMPGAYSQEKTRKPEVGQNVTPPEVVREKFRNMYPDVTPVWKMDGQNYAAEFLNPETLKGMRLVFNKDGHVLRKESELDSSYPQSINDYYIKKYPGEKYKIWSTVDETGQNTYFIQRGTETIRFDNRGQYVKP